MAVKVSSKYQVVIPENVRSLLGLKPGTQVDVIAKGGISRRQDFDFRGLPNVKVLR